ncbi:hypothetical protein DXG03_007121 [Asterophora parasitica]|uniref:Uncharacterized protein n=1 Tax=Asterophora parasitica TaxID=117018 RepID=A0A9P7KDJ4_9AGAR|nr:hypothetical protein DXG03_007121 [Asterophora parasitica]
MSISSRHQESLRPSSPSLHHAASLRSTARRPPPPPIATVITSPPWARDEPPSPKENHRTPLIEPNHATDSRPSDVASYTTTNADSSPWWSFTLPRPHRHQQLHEPPSPTTPKPERKGLKDLSSLSAWLPTSSSIREGHTFSRKDKEKEPEDPRHGWNDPITLPAPPAAPYTLAHTTTPGWDSPWSPRTAAQGPVHNHDRISSYGLNQIDESDASQHTTSIWRSRKQRLRAFILINPYVPLLFRLINITFTTSALALAIHIRHIELKGHAMGAVGSSPTVVIIFAPLTLVHVMVAIYLEYFGRPLGLWRTSAKLAHTLSEVLFICAWSAALSLSFDNFFTSLIPCASPSSTSWYNELPRPPSILPTFESGLGDRICDSQLALICLVGIGLLAYCTNLIISLFRIFEKVKYHSVAPLRT